MFGSRTKTASNFEQIASKTFKWRSSEQNFVAWDKEAQEQILLPKDAKLIPLTTTSCVTGSHEQDHGKTNNRWNTIYSNEFTDFKNDYIKVREYDKLDDTRTVLCEGIYNPTIKEFIADKSWARFTTNLYCILDGEVVRVQLAGAAISAWIDFQNKCKASKTNICDCKYVFLKDSVEKRNGAVTFYAPVFGIGEITDEEDDKATEIAREVESKIEHNKSIIEQDEVTDVTEEIHKSAKVEKSSDGTIDLSEIPF